MELSEEEDGDAQYHQKKPAKDTQSKKHVKPTSKKRPATPTSPESSEDEAPRTTQPSRKKKKTIVPDSDASDHEKSGQKRKGKTHTVESDSDLEIIEKPEEDPEEELERMAKDWTSPIYGFFGPRPSIEIVDGRRCHEFKCGAPQCKGKGPKPRIVRRYLDKADKGSTSNMHKHAKNCWGEETVKKALETKHELSIEDIRKSLTTAAKQRDGSITAIFERKGKGPVTFSSRPHTYTETRVECVKWVAESMRSMKIIDDPGFHRLMKTGRPHYRIPSLRTVAQDVHAVFRRVHGRIAKMLQEYDGRLNFATDAWTSPNQRAFVAVTVHLEHDGEPISLLLDIVEVAVSHSGANLANAFAKILVDYGISEKILGLTCDNASANDKMIEVLSRILSHFPGAANRARCLAHIVNLVVKIILRQFDVKKKNNNNNQNEPTVDLQDEIDDDDLNELAEDLEKEEKEMDEGGDEDGEEDAEILAQDIEAVEQAIGRVGTEVKPVQRVLCKVSPYHYHPSVISDATSELRKLAYAIKNSSTILLPRWYEIVEECAAAVNILNKKKALTVRKMPRDVTTRWNSTYDMLTFAYAYRAAIDKITGERALKLRDYELSETEWAIVKQLRDSLKIFKTVTLEFSNDTPCPAMVIPAIDKMHAQLSAAAENDEYSPASPKYPGVTRVEHYSALREANRIHDLAPVSVYCDGSGFEGGIGASAVLYVDKAERASLRYHLGPTTKHTVYEAEIVGLTLGLHLLTKLTRSLDDTTAIGSDSQATIKALNNQRPHPGHYLLDHVHSAAEKLHFTQDRLARADARSAAKRRGNPWTDRRRRVIDLQIHWTPGHVDFDPNERADELAKTAAQGTTSSTNLLPVYLRRKPLPASIPALRQEHLTALRATWKKRWKKSPRFSAINAIDKSLPSKKFLKLVEYLDRRRSATVAQLRTGHSPLNQHLFRIHRAESPSCPHCLGITVETVRHYLLICPRYQHERHLHLRRNLKRKAESISYLLTSPDALKHLLRFVHATKRFKTSAQSARCLAAERAQEINTRARQPAARPNPLLHHI
ncbi:hypothetical protein D9615_008911 [Tricholomella constricta]|uniref:RNase H type-1 domain-containing protein n=1 Tax=Tricholomella constricta TaxID=117010 RepID=A0A8H5LZ21_9AGAR|nr:hypothetical protein D9615_008911 [Tricholomella constricta]